MYSYIRTYVYGRALPNECPAHVPLSRGGPSADEGADGYTVYIYIYIYIYMYTLNNPMYILCIYIYTYTLRYYVVALGIIVMISPSADEGADGCADADGACVVTLY